MKSDEPKNLFLLYDGIKNDVLYSAVLPAKINGKNLKDLKVDDIIGYVQRELKESSSEDTGIARTRKLLSSPFILRPKSSDSKDRLKPDTSVNNYLVPGEMDGVRYTKLEIILDQPSMGGKGGGGMEVSYKR